MNQYNRADLLKVPLPRYKGGNYTVVSHFKAVGTIEDCLTLNSLGVSRESYQLSKNGNLASGNLTLSLKLDEESTCFVHFLNSYDKSRAFYTKAGIRMNDSGNVLILSKSGYRRVHKGSANEAIETNLCSTIATLEEDFKELIAYKDMLKDIKIDHNETFTILGDLFFEQKVLNSEQMNYVKEQLNNEDYTYNWSKGTAFWLYMLCSGAIENRGNAVDAYSQSHTKLNEYFTAKYK